MTIFSKYKKTIVTLFVIFLLALSVRGVLLYYLHDANYFLGIKAQSDALAQSISSGQGFSWNGKPYSYDLPGYAFFVALTYVLSGQQHSDLIAQVIQIILSSLCIFLVYAIAIKFFDRRAAFLAALFWAVWLPEARISVAPIHDGLMSFLVLLSVYFFVVATLEKKNWFYVFSAIAVGVSSYMRSDPLLLPLFFGSALWIYSGDWKEAFKKTAIMLAVVFLILLPWGLRNYYWFGKFEVTRTVMWQGFWEGFGEFPNPFGAILSDEKTYYQIAKDHPGIAADSDEYQKILKEKTISAIKEYPMWYATMLPQRLFNMVFLPRNLDIGLSIQSYSRQSFFESHHGAGNIDYAVWLIKTAPWVFFVRIMVSSIFYTAFVLLFFISLLVFRKRWRVLILLLSPLLYFYLSHLPIYWEPRYLVPGEFPYLIFSAALLVFLHDKLTKKAKV